MGRRRKDPRTTTPYLVMIDVIDFIDRNGPSDIYDICTALAIDYPKFRKCRYSHGGQLAMEDRQVTMPRPVCTEGFVYKLAENYRAGSYVQDGEPNIKTTVSDNLTRMAVCYSDIVGLCDKIPAKTALGRSVRKLRRAIDSALDRAEDTVNVAGSLISERAAYVLDNRP